jgi:hypothetical protein
MTKEEFIRQYCAEFLARPCDCGYEGCRGWTVDHKEDLRRMVRLLPDNAAARAYRPRLTKEELISLADSPAPV